MSEQAAPQQIPDTENPNSHPETVNGISAHGATDISMTDAPAAQAATPSPLPTTTATTTARIPTPVPTPGQPPNQQHQPTSRAASQHPTEQPGTTTSTTTTTAMAGFAMPAEAAAHGAPVRQYLNSRVTGVLLEGMKIVARDQPKDPLRVLGEFLLQRSKELEGKDGSS